MPATLAAKAADVWAVPVGIGHASPLVDGQRVYVFARKGEQEVAQALDLATGKALWSAAYDQPYTMNSAATGHGKGPKSTPLLAGGRLFTLGITGVLSALDAATRQGRSGGTRSTRSSARRRTSARRCRRSSTTASSSPTSAASAAARCAPSIPRPARRSGAGPATGRATPRRWRSSPAACARSSPRRRRRSWASTPRTGALLWSLPFVTPYEQNAVTPAVAGDMVILSGLDQSTFAVRPTRGADGQVDAGEGLGAQGVPDVHELAGRRRRHRLRPDPPQQGPVLRARRRDRQDALDQPAAPGRERVDHRRRRPAVVPDHARAR